METKTANKPLHRPSQSGTTLIETVIALAILLIVAAGIMTVAIVGVTTTENQGNLGARTAEYAQDKIEQLLSLAYTDAVSDTGGDLAACGIVACNSGGTGLGGIMAANTTVGSSDPANPATGYVDYLDASGNPLGGGATAPVGWYYQRVWQITTLPTTANLKQITVTCKVAFGVGASGIGALAQSTVITMKASSF